MTQIRILWACIVMLTGTVMGWSQQLPLISQFTEYQGVINPGSVQYDYFQDGFYMSAGISHRQQWSKIPTAPKTQFAFGEYEFETDNRFNLLSGVYIVNDKAGHISQTGIYGRIASVYQLQKSGWQSSMMNGGFAVGLLGGIVQYRLNAKELRSLDIEEDPRLLDKVYSIIRPDIGIGLSFYKRFKRPGRRNDFIKGGLSVPQLLSNTLNYTSDFGNEISSKRVPHFYANLDYYLDLKKGKYISFSSWYRYVYPINPSFDLFVKLKFTEFMWVRAGVSTLNTFHTEVGFTLDDWVRDLDRWKFALSYSPAGPMYTQFLGNVLEMSLSYMITD